MNHNRFLNGTFDPEPYETTMDSSFYPKSSFNPDKVNYYNKRGSLEGIITEDDIFRSPQSSISNINYHPSLNNKFRKRIMGKPLQFDQSKLAKLNKMAFSGNRRNDSSENSNYKIPNIGKPLKSHVIRSNRSSKNLKNSNTVVHVKILK